MLVQFDLIIYQQVFSQPLRQYHLLQVKSPTKGFLSMHTHKGVWLLNQAMMFNLDRGLSIVYPVYYAADVQLGILSYLMQLT